MEKTNKFIDFIITQKCTYKCSYCLQSKAQTNICSEASLETFDAFYRFLDNLDKDYEITITGGEAILHPNFFEIIEQTKKRGFKINLISNLSFKIETYKKIFNLLGDSLNRFDVSFHIDEIQNFNLMLEKLEEFLKAKPSVTKTTFYIPLYNVDTKKELKIDKILRLAKRYNIEYSFQKIRFMGMYKNEENQKFSSSHTRINSFAKMCFAGCESAVIYENGEVYRCYSSRFLKSNYLGNIKDSNFSLNESACVCSSIFCACPKPQRYNQLCVEKDKKQAYKDAFINLAYLPKLMFKNKAVLLSKIKQFLNIK